MNILLSNLLEHFNSAVFTLLVLLLAVSFFLVWKVSAWLSVWKERSDSFNRMENDIHDVKGSTQSVKRDVEGVREEVKDVRKDVEGVREEVKDVRKDVEGVREEVKDVRKDVEDVRKDVEGVRKDVEGVRKDVFSLGERINSIYQLLLPNPSVKSSSPLILTDSGKEISKAIKASELLKLYENELRALVQEENPKNAYDIQKICMRIAEQKLQNIISESELTAAKNEAYQRGVPLDSVLAVVGLLLRDMILNETGLGGDDVDRHDPVLQK